MNIFSLVLLYGSIQSIGPAIVRGGKNYNSIYFYLGTIIFSDPLLGHNLILFLSYIRSREKFFNL